jgi:hypothetical protein
MTLKVQPSTGGAAVPATPEQLQQIRADLGLGNVNNSADADKPVSTAQAAADNLRVPKSVATAKGQVLVGLGAGNVGVLPAPPEGAALVGDPSAPEGVGFVTADERESDVFILSTDTAALIKQAVETLQAETTPTAPFGRGRRINFPAAKITTGSMALSTMQSLKGVKGSSVPFFDPAGLADGEHGHLVLQDDSLAMHGIRGNGVIEDLDFDGNRQGWEAANPSKVVHGYWAPDRSSGKCIAHTMRNVAFYGHTGIGVNIGRGNDQFVGERVRVEGSKSWAMRLASSDIKGSKFGLTGDGGALFIDSCAPELDTMDLFMPASFTGECTLLIYRSQRVQMKGGTVEGRSIVRGRNALANGRYENSRIRLQGLAFKHSDQLNSTPGYSGGTPLYVYDSYLTLEDIDGVTLDGCSFGFSESLDAALLPDYLMAIRATGGVAARRGKVFLSNAQGLVSVLGRVGDGVYRQRMGCKKHWADRPKETVFEWGAPGAPRPMPLWAVDSNDPTVRTHVRCDGTTYSKLDLPFLYLSMTLDPTPGGNNNGTLDDGVPNCTVPDLPLISSSYCWAIPALP